MPSRDSQAPFKRPCISVNARSDTTRRSLHSHKRPQRKFTFLLLERFTMLAFASAIEPLRMANRILGYNAYSWKLAGETGGEVTCSNGASLRLDIGLAEGDRDDVILVCGGLDVHHATTRNIVNWLRREARRGAIIGGLCTGAYALAKAGLLEGKSATIHWENHDGFAEEFTNITITKSLFVLESNRWTSAGGTAALDLMLKIIANDHDDILANTVADQLIYSTIRIGHDSQRLSVPSRIGVRHPKLGSVIQLMEAHIEDPLTPADFAQRVDLSTRQLERLFSRYLGKSPKRYYRELRLAKARNLLMQTDMSVINIALSCGFSSPSHFSKCYRLHYGCTPYRERGILPDPRSPQPMGLDENLVASGEISRLGASDLQKELIPA